MNTTNSNQPDQSDQCVTVIKALKPVPSKWQRVIEYPTESILNQVIAFFENCKLVLQITVNKETCILKLKSGQPINIPIISVGTQVQIDLRMSNLSEESYISTLSCIFLNMEPIPIEPRDVTIDDFPEHGIAIAIDFTDAIDIAKGVYDCTNKKVELKLPNGTVCTIRENSENYFWRGDSLHCNLPSGENSRLRLQYETEKGWSEWSAWILFETKRKMSL